MLSTEKSYELIYAIINHGMGSQVLKEASRLGVGGGTILQGQGSFHHRWLSLLHLSDVQRDIVWMVVDERESGRVMRSLSQHFRFDQPHRGIIFSVSLTRRKEEGEENSMFDLMTVIVDRGDGELAVDAAVSGGATGATIIDAHGAGSHKISKLISMDLESEKEIVLILSVAADSEAIVQAIRQKVRIDEPGRGLLFVQPIKEAYGLYRK